MKVWILCLWMGIFCGSFLAFPAAAQEGASEVEALEAQAIQAYQEGRFKEAIWLLSQVNQLSPHPNYVLNIAVSYSKLGDCDNAALWATNALSMKDPGLPEEARRVANEVVSKCQQDRAAEQKVVMIQPPPDPPQEKRPSTRAESKVNDRVLYGGLAGGVGVAIVAVTAVLDVQLSGDIEDFSSSTAADFGGSEARFERERDDLKTRQNYIAGGYIVGAGFAILGTGLAALGWDEAEGVENASIVPWISSDVQGASVSWGF